MHIMHLIAVEADDEEDAVSAAEEAILPYGEGDVWDWYEVGGRWEGYFDGKNVVNFKENPEEFRKGLSSAAKAVNDEFRDLANKLSGKEIHETDTKDHLWGIPVKDRKGVAERVTAHNEGTKELFDQVLSMDSLPPRNLEIGMLGYCMSNLGKLLCGQYQFHSFFFDAVAHEARVTDVMGRCEDEEGHRQYLVVVDLHN
jgi:hypothetical protein